MPHRPAQDAALTRRTLIKTIGALGAGIAAPALWRVGEAFAAYPERPIRIVVANTPGGPSDIIARIMAAAMTETIGGSVIVENKGGAGGNIGMGLVARAEPDGYTILLSTSAYSVNPGLYQNLPYDPFKDFVAICELLGYRALGMYGGTCGKVCGACDPRPSSCEAPGVRRFNGDRGTCTVDKAGPVICLTAMWECLR